MRVLILLLTFPLSVLGQTTESEKTDSFHIYTFAFPTYSLKINNYSASDPAEVFIVPEKSFDSVKKQIPKLYFSQKQEYNEYYVLGVHDMSETNILERAVTEFLNRIDSARVARNRSSFLRRYTWDKTNNRLIYQKSTKPLSQVDNLHYLNSTKDICKYMACRNR